MINESYAALFAETSTHVREGMASGLYPFGQALASPQASRARLDGRDVVMLTSNNYLGLATDPRVIEAVKAGLDEFGASTCGARLHNGTTVAHTEFEAQVADWLGYDDAVLFSSGFMANAGTLSALGGPGSVFIRDQLTHASLNDGCALSGAEQRIFTHNDMAKLERILATSQEFDRRLVVVDSVYSMDGDLAPLDVIDDLCTRYDALLMVDEAHGFGVVGETGRGLCEHFGVQPDIYMSTLSKALGSAGGFVATGRALADHLRHQAHAYVFNASAPPATIRGAQRAFELMRSEPERRERLFLSTIAFRQGLLDAGFAISSGVTPIVPIPVGDEITAMGMARQLKDDGVLLSLAMFPAVPRGQARFRTTITAALTDPDLEHALDSIIRVGSAALTTV